MNKQSWSVVILNYEEEQSVEKVVLEVITVLDKLNISDREIIIVDDFSKDNSKKIIEEISNKYDDIKVVFHNKNRGIGEATRSGHDLCTKDNVYLISSDGEADVNELSLVQNQEIKEDEFILFERKINPNYGFYRHFLSFINRTLNFIFFGKWIYDVNWNKIIKNYHVKNLILELNSGLVDAEIVFKLLKKKTKIRKISSKSNLRKTGKSEGASLKSLEKVILDVFKLWKVVSKY